uniref:Uncharacterized protein n=1 Tax=Romanomermis culicivorax TaxID=13658 RepID=A0A915JMV2_ROMCU
MDSGRQEVAVLDETVRKLKDERDRLAKQLDAVNRDAADVHMELHARKIGKENFEQKCNSLWGQLQEELSKDVDVRLTKNVFENYRILRRKIRQPAVVYSIYRPPNLSRNAYRMEKLDIELNRLSNAKKYVGTEKGNVEGILRLRCQGPEKLKNLEIRQMAQNQLFTVKPKAPDVSDMEKGLERLRNVLHRHGYENDGIRGMITKKNVMFADQQLDLKFLLEKTTKILNMLLQKKRKLREELDICLEKLKRLLDQDDEDQFSLEIGLSRVAELKDQLRSLERKLHDFRKRISLLKRKSTELKAELVILVESLDRKKAINVQLGNLVQDMEKDAETREIRKKEEEEDHTLVKSRKNDQDDMKVIKEAIQILEELDATRLPPAWLSNQVDRIVAEGQRRIAEEGLKPDQVQRSAIKMIEHKRMTSREVETEKTLETDGPLIGKNSNAKKSPTVHRG